MTSAGLTAFFAAAAAWWAWATRGFDETADEVEEGSSRATPAVAVLVLLVPVLSLGIASLLPILEISFFATTRTHGFFVWVAETVGDDRVSSTAVVGTAVLLAAGAVQHARRRPSLVAAWLGIVGHRRGRDPGVGDLGRLVRVGSTTQGRLRAGGHAAGRGGYGPRAGALALQPGRLRHRAGC